MIRIIDSVKICFFCFFIKIAYRKTITIAGTTIINKDFAKYAKLNENPAKTENMMWFFCFVRE